jgi:7-cyano-7-deazaguanine synthase
MYGSKHNAYERQAAIRIIQHYVDRYGEDRVIPNFFDLSEVFKPFQSNLLQSGGEIPEGHYEDESMKKTVVPGRNLIIASILAGLAESVGAEEIALGVHSGDHHIYPDCRPEFVASLYETVAYSSDGKVAVKAPFEKMMKADILRLGFTFEVPYYMTRTCYKDQEKSCGKCGSCRERLEAFIEVSEEDPIEYDTY